MSVEKTKELILEKLKESLKKGNDSKRRVCEVLPILVRQAEARETITYKDLARETGIHHRPLKYVLGHIGETLIVFNDGSSFGKVPHIQSLVINKETKLPGSGIDQFINELLSSKMEDIDRRHIVEKIQHKVFKFKEWRKVLKKLGLEAVQSDFSDISSQASRASGGGGEGPEHKKLKSYVANNPDKFGLPKSVTHEIEYALPSGDKLDVFFKQGRKHIGVEVKPKISDIGDITRGMYQCIKYQAVLEAEQRVKGQKVDVRTFLVIGGKLNKELCAIKNILGVEVYEDVSLT